MYKIKAPRKAFFSTRNLAKLTAINVAVFVFYNKPIKFITNALLFLEYHNE